MIMCYCESCKAKVLTTKDGSCPGCGRHLDPDMENPSGASPREIEGEADRLAGHLLLQNLGIAIGLVIVVAAGCEEVEAWLSPPGATLLRLVATGFFVWACRHFAFRKGRDLALGWLGLLNIFGVIILAWLPSRPPQTHRKGIAVRDSQYVYLFGVLLALAVISLPIFAISRGGAPIWFLFLMIFGLIMLAWLPCRWLPSRALTGGLVPGKRPGCTYLILGTVLVLAVLGLRFTDGSVSPAAFYMNRGRSFLQRGDDQRGIEEFTKAIESQPTLAAAYVNRGLAYHRTGEFDKAIADCSEAMRLDPTLVQAYINRSLFYAEQGENEKAIADCTESLMN